jgi:hypothetical protein
MVTDRERFFVTQHRLRENKLLRDLRRGSIFNGVYRAVASFTSNLY